jgi:very-short-patch-repair endonuclease
VAVAAWRARDSLPPFEEWRARSLGWLPTNTGWLPTRSCSPPVSPSTRSRVGASAARFTRSSAASTRSDTRPWDRSAGSRPPLLAIGGDAVLSHRAAATVWGFRRWDGGRIDVTTSRHLRPLKLHASLLEQEDHTRKEGLSLTTPNRTLLDVAPTATPDALTHLVGQAEQARLVSVPTLRRDLDRWGKRRGAAKLAKTIAHGHQPTRSLLEVRFLPFLERESFPRPKVNAKLHRFEVDALYEDHKLVIELDSRRWHEGAFAQAKDRNKTADLEAEGYRVMRITSDDLKDHPTRTAQRLRAALS